MVKLSTLWIIVLLSDKDTSTSTFSKLQSHKRINKAGSFGNAKMTNLCERFCLSVCKKACN